MKHLYRLPPCPAYDVPGMERWLEEMAQAGWLLEEDGFFAGFAAFAPCAPQSVRFRLSAVLKPPSLWNEDSPDGEALALSENYGWTYAGRRGDFYIYYTADPAAREMHTDPAVQALALRAVERRRRSSLLTAVFWLAVYPLACLRGGLVLPVLQLGSCFSLFTLALVLWLLAGSFREVWFLGRLRKSLLAGETPPPTPRRYPLRRLALVLCICLWVGLALHGWSASVTEADRRPLAGYDPPFATLADLAGEGDYSPTFPDTSFSFVREWSDPLAPQNIQWAEHAQVHTAGGELVSGGLRIDYHQTRHPLLARLLAQDYCRLDRQGKLYTPLDLPPLDLDFSAAYLNGSTHFPTLVLCRGNTVLHAVFYQTGETPVPLSQWSAILAESMVR